MNKIEISVAFEDARGKITDLIENETINAVTLITFRKGAARGNHYHEKTTQWNYLLSGKIKLVTQIPDKEVTETIMEPGDFTMTVPNERHTLFAIEDAELMVFTKGPRGGKEYENDTFRLDKLLIESEI
jgi:quercetin dioxygenase-like cupin family protein